MMTAQSPTTAAGEPPPPENISQQTDSDRVLTPDFLRGYLTTIGVFIGTHGLAVFLVVYYAVSLYPEARRERGEWIAQVTRLRELIDPQTRQLTPEQAEATLDLVIDRYMERLELNIELFSRDYNRGMSWSDTSMDVWGETFEWQETLDDDQSDRSSELKNLIAKFTNVLGERQKDHRARVTSAFRIADKADQSTSYRLGRLQFSNTTLDEVWDVATDRLVDEWEAQVSLLDSSTQDRYEIAELQKFLRNHPAYADLTPEERAPIDNSEASNEARSMEKTLRDFRALLKRNTAVQMQALSLSEGARLQEGSSAPSGRVDTESPQ